MTPLNRTSFLYYDGSSSPVAAPEGACVAGSKNMIVTGSGKMQAFKGLSQIVGVSGSRTFGNTPDGGYAGLGTALVNGIGSIVGLVARAFAFIGSGQLFINGIDRAVAASTALQILLFRSGSYTGAGTGPLVAGLDPPSAPTAAVTPNASTLMNGKYSVVAWFVRSATGGRSRKSTASAVFTNSGFKTRVTISGADLAYASAHGVDRIGVGVPQAGFGATGPHYELQEIAISALTTVDGVANSYEFDWSDAMLVGQPLAPVDDYPPPAGAFAVGLEDSVAVIGCLGDSVSGVTTTNPGTAIAISLPVFIESFPPDYLLYLPEAPTAVLSRPTEGYAFIGCANSLHALSYTGAQPPMALKGVWANVGVAHSGAMWLGEGGRLYVFTSKRTLVRLDGDGDPDSGWAKEVADDVASWDPSQTFGGYDSENQQIVIGNGTTLLCYNPHLGRWGSPIDLLLILPPLAQLCGMVTVKGALMIAYITSGINVTLYHFNSGSGSLAAVVTREFLSPAEADELFRVRVAGRFDATNPLTLYVLKNGEALPSATKTLTVPRTGLQHLSARINVRGAKSYRLQLQQQSGGGDAGFDVVEVSGVRSGVVL
jgi:hypothetical protein